MGLAFLRRRRAALGTPRVAPEGPQAAEAKAAAAPSAAGEGPALLGKPAGGSAEASASSLSLDLASSCCCSEHSSAGDAGTGPEGPAPDCSHRYGIDYLRHPVAAYCRLPAPLRQILALPTPIRTIMVAARPTIQPSGGLAHYRSAVPRPARRSSPFFAVVDEPGLPADELAGQGGKYHWVELPIPPAYRLDLQGVASFEQYVSTVMGRNQRRNHRLRQQKWEAAGCLSLSYQPLQRGDRAAVQELWRLYKQNGERNGQLVVRRRDFFRIHLAADGLSVMAVRDSSRGGALVSFATGVKCGDTLISTWCGTDYGHPLSRECSCYLQTQYAFVREAIADPDVRWLDLGALHRTIKQGSLCAQPHHLSTYLRCKSKLLARLVRWGANRWFTLERLQAAGVVRDM